jgi:putative transposase
MPRRKRFLPPDSVVHALNRANDRRRLFDADEEYEEFLELVAWSKQQEPMRVIAYCLMPNHWHFVLWPETSDAVPFFLHRLSTTHAIKRRKQTRTVGQGHIYQGRYKGFVIESEAYYLRALRYVESNPLRAGLVKRSADWPWSSLRDRAGQRHNVLDVGPLRLPDDWTRSVDESLPADFLADIRSRLKRHGGNNEV